MKKNFMQRRKDEEKRKQDKSGHRELRVLMRKMRDGTETEADQKRYIQLSKRITTELGDEKRFHDKFGYLLTAIDPNPPKRKKTMSGVKKVKERKSQGGSILKSLQNVGTALNKRKKKFTKKKGRPSALNIRK